MLTGPRSSPRHFSPSSRSCVDALSGPGIATDRQESCQRIFGLNARYEAKDYKRLGGLIDWKSLKFSTSRFESLLEFGSF